MTRTKSFAIAGYGLAAVFALLEVFYAGMTNDTSAWMHCALRLWRFGPSEFYSRCWDPNAPFHAMVYSPLAGFAAYAHITPSVVLHGAAALLSVFSLCVLGRTLTAHGIERGERNIWLGTAAFTLLVAPAMCGVFADREHLLFIMALPWMLQMLLHLRPLPYTCALAAVGFCMKPIDVVLFAGIALICGPSEWSLRQRLFSLSSWIIGLGLLCYAASIYFLFPTYIHEVLPVVSLLYPTVHKSIVYKFTYGGILPIPALLLIWVGVRSWRERITWLGFALTCTTVFFLNGGWIYTAYLLLVPLVLGCAAPWIARYSEQLPPKRLPAIRIVTVLIAVLVLCVSGQTLRDDMAFTRKDGRSQFFYRPSPAPTVIRDLRREAGKQFILLSPGIWATNVEGFATAPEAVFKYDNIWVLNWLYRSRNEKFFPAFMEMFNRDLLKALKEYPTATLIVDDSPVILLKPDEYLDILGFLRQDPQIREALAPYRKEATLDYCGTRPRQVCRLTVWRRPEGASK